MADKTKEDLLKADYKRRFAEGPFYTSRQRVPRRASRPRICGGTCELDMRPTEGKKSTEVIAALRLRDQSVALATRVSAFHSQRRVNSKQQRIQFK